MSSVRNTKFGFNIFSLTPVRPKSDRQDMNDTNKAANKNYEDREPTNCNKITFRTEKKNSPNPEADERTRTMAGSAR